MVTLRAVTNGMTKGIKGPSNTIMLYLITVVALMESHQMSQRQPMTSETVKEAVLELVKVTKMQFLKRPLSQEFSASFKHLEQL